MHPSLNNLCPTKTIKLIINEINETSKMFLWILQKNYHHIKYDKI